MQLQLNKILTELGLIATVGVGILLIRNKPHKLSHDYTQYKVIGKTAFPAILEKFKALDQGELFEDLCTVLDEYLDLSDKITSGSNVRAGQFQMNRLCNEIDVRSKQMIYNARSSSDTDTVIACIDCEQDEFNMLNSYCHNILQNMLLSN